MLQFFRRIGLTGRKAPARRVAPVVRLHLEHLEQRELLTVAIPPTGVVATGISASAINVNWNASTDHSVTGYDVFEKTWVVSGGGKGSHGGRWVYTEVGSNLTTPHETLTGLKSGSTHNYVVTAVNASGQSLDSYAATAETWIAPSFSYTGYYLLSDGYYQSGPVSATAGLTTQISLLISGNPLTFSVVSGPSNLSINAKTGVVTFTPSATETGTFSATFKASNALGSVTQTIQFNVAPYGNLAKPKLILTSPSSFTYNGQGQYVSAEAVGTDGVTPIAGTYAYAYNGVAGAPANAGTYQVLVTFTSYDSNYGNATLLTTFTIKKATPTFSGLTAQTIAQGNATTTFTGSIYGGNVSIPTGEYITVTLNGVSEVTTPYPNGTFSVTFDTSALALGTYTVSYAFAGDANFLTANGSSTVKVIPTAPPTITQNPSDATTSAGDYASFTAAATGSPPPTVQWQISTDGGQTWANITGNASAQTTTLTVYASSTSMTGYKYRAVFTNRIGTATTTAATLTVEGD